jgi:hypothetical protein
MVKGNFVGVEKIATIARYCVILGHSAYFIERFTLEGKTGEGQMNTETRTLSFC